MALGYPVVGYVIRRHKDGRWRTGGTHYSWGNIPGNAEIYQSQTVADGVASLLKDTIGKKGHEVIPVVFQTLIEVPTE